MPITTAPLVWNYYREISDSADIVGLVHYYDEQSQSLYLKDGDLTTNVAVVEQGHWRDAIQGSPLTINDDTFVKVRLDHPSNGTLYGVAFDGSALVFLRYIYAMDISHLMESWSWTTQTDNAIAQFSGSIQNLGPDIFAFDATLFQPGARMSIGITMGDGASYPLGVAWIDECSFDISAETVDLSGRNTIGYFLKDQTFDNQTTWEAGASSTIESIFEYGGITKYKVESSEHVQKFIFEPHDSLLDGIAVMSSYYNSKTELWKLAELPDGTVCLGYETWLSQFLPNTHYTFNAGSDVFKRKTTKLSDSSYTALRVTGKDANNNELTPIIVPVNNFKYWALGGHRTQHLRAPDGLTQAGMQEWAEAQAQKYQYIGIGEDFVGVFRPQLLVGDIAEVIEDETGIALGLINEVRQIFSRRDGFKTEFSVDSGGVVTDGSGYTVYSRAAEVSGFNRRQRVVDLVRYITKK